jgi:hypothetical protein
MRPITVGPNTIPANISATTPGCLKGAKMNARHRDTMIMRTTCAKNKATADGSGLPCASPSPPPRRRRGEIS